MQAAICCKRIISDTMNFTLDEQAIKRMAHFERITRAHAKDVFEDDNGTLTFVVQEGQLSKALGPKASNARKLQQQLKQKVRIIEYDPDVQKFVANAVKPNTCTIEIKDNMVTMIPHDLKTRGNLIGRAASHLRNTEKIVKRYFPIEKMQVTNVQEEWSYE